MSVTIANPMPVQAPPSPPPAVTPPQGGTSPELGEQLSRLHTEQAEYDRERVEELARLRALQDRD